MSVKNQIVIYGGRFQPFHIGHYGVYKELCDKYGKNNVYIATSNKVQYPKSPFNFDEKKKIISTMFKDINKNNIIQVITPYKPINVFKTLGNKINDDTVAIYALGEKDGKRLINGKFFKPISDLTTTHIGYKKAGYVDIVSMKGLMDGHFVSGTEIRNLFNDENTKLNQKQSLFTILYKQYNKKIFDLILNKLNPNYSQLKEMFNSNKDIYNL